MRTPTILVNHPTYEPELSRNQQISGECVCGARLVADVSKSLDKVLGYRCPECGAIYSKRFDPKIADKLGLDQKPLPTRIFKQQED